jgi:hypothetical protein
MVLHDLRVQTPLPDSQPRQIPRQGKLIGANPDEVGANQLMWWVETEQRDDGDNSTV